MARSSNPSKDVFLHLHPVHRVLISLAAAFLFIWMARNSQLDGLVKWMFAWDIFAVLDLTMIWIVFVRRPVSRIREFARKDDPSLLIVFLLVILASFSSLGALILLFISTKAASLGKMLYLFGAVPAMILSWAMIHTVFTSHYAYMYYDDSEEDENVHAGGLEFPNEKKPDYVDFAYFSFVIGMTFQVSDVQITSRKIRRVALVHGLLAFVLNTIVVALTINLVAGLKN